MNSTSINDVESIPPSLGTLLRKLEFLSMIEKGQKPCMHNWVFVDADSWTASYYSYFKGEHKSNMMIHIQNIIEEIVRGFNDYPRHQTILINTLVRARRGIENLKYTYKDYPDTKSSIIVTLQNIDIQEKRYGDLIERRTVPIKIPVKNVYSEPSLRELSVEHRSTPDTASERFERPPSSRIIPMLPSYKAGYSFKSETPPSSREIDHSDIVDENGESKLDMVAPDPSDNETMLVYPDLESIDNGTYFANHGE